LLFSALFLFHRKSIPNRVQTQNQFLWIFSGPEDTRRTEDETEWRPWVGTTHQGAPGGPRAPWWVVAHSGTPSTASSSYKFPNILKPFVGRPRSEVPPPKASVSTRNQSGPFSGNLPEGGIITGGHLHHPGGLHDEEGVVLPRG